MRFVIGLVLGAVLAGAGAGIVIAGAHRPTAAAAAPPPSSPHAFEIGTRWETVEGLWRGSWVRQVDGTFAGTWTSNAAPMFRGTLAVRVAGDELVVERRDHDGYPDTSSQNTCVYRARLDSIPAAWRGPHVVVAGTASCTNTNHQWVTPWAARIVR